MGNRITKHIDFDINDTINIKITLNTDEIAQFIEECDQSEKNKILSRLKSYGAVPEGIVVRTLGDEMKFSILAEAFNKMTLVEIEARLK